MVREIFDDMPVADFIRTYLHLDYCHTKIVIDKFHDNEIDFELIETVGALRQLSQYELYKYWLKDTYLLKLVVEQLEMVKIYLEEV